MRCDLICDVVSLLAEHTKTIHLAKFSSLGLSITTPGLPTSPSPAPAGQKRARPSQPSERVMTPPAKQIVLQPRANTPRRGRARAGPAQYRLPAPQVRLLIKLVITLYIKLYLESIRRRQMFR